MKYGKLILSLFMAISITGCAKLETKNIPVLFTRTVELKTETVETEPHYIYVICDVVGSYGECPEDIYATNLLCEMPDGTLHVYQIEDAPEGKVELVCFKTDNQDDYTTYEIVAVR